MGTFCGAALLGSKLPHPHSIKIGFQDLLRFEYWKCCNVGAVVAQKGKYNKLKIPTGRNSLLKQKKKESLITQNQNPKPWILIIDYYWFRKRQSQWVGI